MTPQHFNLTAYLHQEEGQFFDRKSLLHGPPGRKKARPRAEVRAQIARYQAYREMRAMVEAGFLAAPDHPGPGGAYQVKLNLQDGGRIRKESEEDPIQTLRARMETRGFLKNQDVQECQGVSRATANRILADLVDKGILTREKASRFYRPGPQWAVWRRPTRL